MQMASSSLLSLFVLLLLFSISSAYTSKSSFLDGTNHNPIKMIKVADGVSEDLLNLNGMEVKNNQKSGNGSNAIVRPWGRRGLCHRPYDDGTHIGITQIGLDYITDVAIVGINVACGCGHGTFNHTAWFPSNASVKISLDFPSEYITEVSRTTVDLGQLFGGIFRSTTFKTNTNKTFGPYGSISGTSFNLPIESGFIVGFKGSIGVFLSSLGIYLSPSDYK